MSDQIKAAIFDLDGVITDTASTHFKAWKIMFDHYNKERVKVGQDAYEPFTEEDYLLYVDGKPRYKGVKDFLASRKIILPQGTPEDAPDTETVCGLGNSKNRVFLDLIKKEGVDILEENVKKAKEWKNAGCKLAIVSSSKNCKRILEAVDLEYLFEARIDGITAAKNNYRGKPEPDIFVQAARELDVPPADALIVEDALAGVEAGKNGNFGLVIGITDSGNEEDMIRHGADIVVKNLSDLPTHPVPLRPPASLPSAREHFNELRNEYQDHQLYLFLDYDGTLTPIVEDYNAAFISEDMRDLVRKVSGVVPVAIITGRDLKDIMELVGLEELHFAGSHGFEMVGPGGFVFENEEAKKSLKKIDEAAEIIREKTADIEGVKFEKKKFALAVHYRQVAESQVDQVKTAVLETIKDTPEIKTGKGKKVIELKPNINWHKGKSLSVLFDRMKVAKGKKPFVLYIGDDITDEDAFLEILDYGAGIMVGDHGQKTFALYHLENVDEVKQLIERIYKDIKS